MNEPKPFLAWPGRRQYAETLLLGSIVTGWWILIYRGADWLAGLHSYRVRVHLDTELAIPFIPTAILAYRSIDLMFLLGPFVLRRREEVRGLVASLFVMTTVAGIAFLAFPAELAFPPQPHQGIWEPFFEWNRHVVLQRNLVPSLHVAMTVVTLAAYSRGGSKLRKALLTAWGAAIVLSTLLLHEHHLLDVVTGLLLGWVGYALVFRRWVNSATAEQIAPASLTTAPAPPA